MRAIITQKQAKQITGGRKPFEIVPYEEAILKLRECLEFDDVKFWQNLADAQEAWARIRHDETLDRLSRQIRLKAAERIGQIALERRPKKVVLGRTGRNGQLLVIAGARDLLVKEVGMSKNQAEACLKLARHPVEAELAVNSARPPTPGSFLNSIERRRGWSAFISKAMWAVVVAQMRATDPKEAAKLAVSESRDLDHVRKQALFMYEWLDAFEQALPRAKK